MTTIYSSDRMSVKVEHDSGFTIFVFTQETITCFDLNYLQSCTIYDCGKYLALSHTCEHELKLDVDGQIKYYRFI